MIIGFLFIFRGAAVDDLFTRLFCCLFDVCQGGASSQLIGPLKESRDELIGTETVSMFHINPVKHSIQDVKQSENV